MKCLSSLETNKINERSTPIAKAILNTSDYFYLAKQLNIKSPSKAEENTSETLKLNKQIPQLSVTLHSISFIETLTNAHTLLRVQYHSSQYVSLIWMQSYTVLLLLAIQSPCQNLNIPHHI